MAHTTFIGLDNSSVSQLPVQRSDDYSYIVLTESSHKVGDKGFEIAAYQFMASVIAKDGFAGAEEIAADPTHPIMTAIQVHEVFIIITDIVGGIDRGEDIAARDQVWNHYGSANDLIRSSIPTFLAQVNLMSNGTIVGEVSGFWASYLENSTES